jgi:hypothetical protein
MGFLSFFRVPKPQRYKYVPRYYNPDKEELESRLAKLRSESKNDPEAMKSRIASGLRRRHKVDADYKKKQMLRSNLILILVIILLLFVSYIVLVRYTPEIIEMLE